jgi:hypothetical protein
MSEDKSAASGFGTITEGQGNDQVPELGGKGKSK